MNKKIKDNFSQVPYLYWDLNLIIVSQSEGNLNFPANELRCFSVDEIIKEIDSFDKNIQKIKGDCFEDCSLDTETSSILQTMSTQVHYGKFCFSSLDLYHKQNFPSIVVIEEGAIPDFVEKYQKKELPIKFVLLKNKMSDSEIIDLLQNRKIHYFWDVSKVKDLWDVTLKWHNAFLEEFNFYFWGRYYRFSDFIDLYKDENFIEWYGSIMKEHDIQASSIFEKGGSFLCSLKNGDTLCVKIYSEEEQEYLIDLDDFYDHLSQEDQNGLSDHKIIVDYKTEHSYVLQEQYLRYSFCHQFYTFEVGKKKYFTVIKKQTSFKI